MFFDQTNAALVNIKILSKTSYWSQTFELYGQIWMQNHLFPNRAFQSNAFFVSGINP